VVGVDAAHQEAEYILVKRKAPRAWNEALSALTAQSPPVAALASPYAIDAFRPKIQLSDLRSAAALRVTAMDSELPVSETRLSAAVPVHTAGAGASGAGGSCGPGGEAGAAAGAGAGGGGGAGTLLAALAAASAACCAASAALAAASAAFSTAAALFSTEAALFSAAAAAAAALLAASSAETAAAAAEAAGAAGAGAGAAAASRWDITTASASESIEYLRPRWWAPRSGRGGVLDAKLDARCKRARARNGFEYRGSAA
jgi:hypothetical protein